MKLKLLLFMGVFSARSCALNARGKVGSFALPPNTKPTIVAAPGQNDTLRYCPGSRIANIEFVIDDAQTLFKDLEVTAVSSNSTYISSGEITVYPLDVANVPTGQRYLGILGNTIISLPFTNGFTTLTVTVVDEHGLSANKDFTIFIEDTAAPEVSTTGLIASGAIDQKLDSATCDYKLKDFTGEEFFTAIDYCTTDRGDIVIDQKATLNGTTYNIGDTIAGKDGDLVLVTLSATDQVGKTSTTTFTITLQDEDLPVLTIIDQIVNENLAVDAADCMFTIKDYTEGLSKNVNVAENCSNWTIKQTPAAGTPVDYAGTNQEQVINFECTDAAGNVAAPVSFTVKIKDNTNPKAKAKDVYQVELNASGNYTFTGAVLNDGSTDNCQIVSYKYSPDSVTCANVTNLDELKGAIVQPITVTMTVTDFSGNTSTSTTKVTVLDITKPVINASPISQNTAQCETLLVSPPTVTVTEACGYNSIDLVGVRQDGKELSETYPIGTTEITWNVTDIHGNIADAVIQKVTMIDIEKPKFVDATLGKLNSLTLDQSFFGLTYAASNVVGSTDVYPSSTLKNSNLKAVVVDLTQCNGANEIPKTFTCDPEMLHLGKNMVTWTAIDAYGNTASATQEVVVEDTTVPVITLKDVIAPFQLDSNGQVVITPEDLDNGTTDQYNGNALKLTVVPNTFGCESVGKDVTVTFYAEDYVGSLGGIPSLNIARNLSQGNQITDENGVVGDAEHKVYKQTTVRFEDKFAPTVLTKNITVQLNASGVASIVASDVDNGSTDACGILSYSLDKTSFSCSDIATPVTVTLTVTDKNNNFSTNTALVTVEDKLAPVITGTTVYIDANTDANACGATVSVTPPTATDNCTVGSPIGTRSDALALNALYPLGTTIITWKLTDANGNVALPTTTTIKVTDNKIPVITTNGDKIVNNDNGICGAVVSVSAAAIDNCNVGVPKGVRNDGKELTAVYPLGRTTITWNVKDANGNAALPVIQTVDVTDAQIPVITSNGNKTANADLGACSAVVTVSATATDNCGVGSPVGVRSDALPLVAAFPVGTTTITWNVTDVNGNAAVAVTQTVIVTDTQRPVITANGNKNFVSDFGQCGAIVAVSATATDNCSVGTPVGTRSDNAALNALYPVGTTTITWNVTDVNLNSATPVVQTVVVRDLQIPVINGTVVSIDANTDANACGASVVVTPPTASDNCSVTASVVGTRSDNLAISALYPIGSTTITWRVSDIYGNVAVPTTTTVKVKDMVKPTVITKNIPVQLNVGGFVTIVPAQVDNGSTDACGIASYSLDKVSFNCSNIGDNTVTLTVIDIHGNVNFATATVTVSEPIIPVARTRNIIVQLNAAGTVSILPSDINNGSTDNCSIASYTLSKDTFTCANIGVNTITLIAKDASGNNSLPVNATVTVQDNVAPVVITKSYTAQLNASGTVTIVPANVNNGSTDNCSIATYSLSKDTFTCANVGSNVISLTATDASGNTKSAFATVIVEDKIAPVVVAKDISLVLDHGTVTIVPEDVLVSATDACGVDVHSYTLSRDTFTITDVLASPVTITVYATDINGNIGSTTAKVIFPINPTTAAQVITPNGDGINDTWVVENITNHQNSVVRVFSRWGSLVYSAKNYQNDWDGKLNGSDATVPDGGSYYYQIDLDGTGKVDSEGWLFISRQ